MTQVPFLKRRVISAARPVRSRADRPRRTRVVHRPVAVHPSVPITPTLARWQLDPRFVPYVERLIQEARRQGIIITITDGRRSIRQQRDLGRRFAAGDRSVLAAAKPGWSFHEYGLAIDYRTSPPGALASVGRLAERLGLRWGGRFGDPVHVDFGRQISIAQARREAGVA